jgi:hypothetical protein
MDVSDLRKRILRALDEGRKDSTARRSAIDVARGDFAAFLENVAVPLLRQAVTVLKSEGLLFSVHTPADSARLAHDKSPETYLELVLDVAGPYPRVVGRVSVTRGRHGVIVEERELAPKAVADLREDDVAKFLVSEVAKLALK